MNTTQRLEQETRKEQILAAAIELSEKTNYRDVTRKEIAAHAKCAPSLIAFWFTDMTFLRLQIMKRAVQTGNAKIVMQGLARHDFQARQAPEALRKKAAALLNT